MSLSIERGLTRNVGMKHLTVVMKHWIFDFDGTLVNTDGFFSQTLGFALAPFNIKVDVDFIESIRHRHPERLFDDHLTPEQIKIAMKRLSDSGRAIADEIKMFPEIPEILETLLVRGESVSIWTGRDLDSTEHILRKNGAHALFKKIITGSCVETNKPGHDGLLEIQRHFSAKTEDMVMIGDHHHDIGPANELGLTSVHARWKTVPVELPKKMEPNFNFDSTLKFHEWVKDNL